jgi:hypothetical protein
MLTFACANTETEDGKYILSFYLIYRHIQFYELVFQFDINYNNNY